MLRKILKAERSKKCEANKFVMKGAGQEYEMFVLNDPPNWEARKLSGSEPIMEDAAGPA